jgi:hypothetical protein
MAGEDSFLCSICFKSVNLKDCKIDEDGRPVHEKCYAARVLYTLPSAGKPSGNSPPDAQGWRGLCRKIMRIVGRR